MNKRGRLYMISGPSGVGKGTVCRKLFECRDDIFFSVSATTRKPREEDTEGVTYYFKTKEEFKRLIEEDAFLEWAEYSGNYYGTLKQPVIENLEKGKNVILEIDVRGALNVRKNFSDGVYIFIAPPDGDALLNRLRGRGSECEEEIKRRLAAADAELKLQSEYDYVIVNDSVEGAAKKICEIMDKER